MPNRTAGAVGAASGALAGTSFGGVATPGHAPLPGSTIASPSAAGKAFAMEAMAAPRLGVAISIGNVGMAFGASVAQFFGMVATPGHGVISHGSGLSSYAGPSSFGTVAGLGKTNNALGGTASTISAAFGALTSASFGRATTPGHAPLPGGITASLGAAGMVFTAGAMAGPRQGEATSIGGVDETFGAVVAPFFGTAATPGHGFG